jgi:hypothetical protein
LHYLQLHNSSPLFPVFLLLLNLHEFGNTPPPEVCKGVRRKQTQTAEREREREREKEREREREREREKERERERERETQRERERERDKERERERERERKRERERENARERERARENHLRESRRVSIWAPSRIKTWSLMRYSSRSRSLTLSFSHPPSPFMRSRNLSRYSSLSRACHI